MKNDPIVADVRAIRDAFAARCDYDLKELVRELRQLQASSGRKYVRYPARRTTSAEDLRASYGD